MEPGSVPMLVGMANVTLSGHPTSTTGELPAPGERLPDFELTGTDLHQFSLDDFAGKRVVLNIFPSMDTGVCAASVRKFNELAADLDNTVVICVSQDLPFAQERFCGAEGIENVTVGSAFRTSFGEDYGVVLNGEHAKGGLLNGLLARSVVVADENHEVVHAELVEEIKTEPDYDAAVAALNA